MLFGQKKGAYTEALCTDALGFLLLQVLSLHKASHLDINSSDLLTQSYIHQKCSFKLPQARTEYCSLNNSLHTIF